MAADPGWQAHLRQVLDIFPPVQHAFAYGSGVFMQPDLYPSSGNTKPMLDFILAVRDPLEWHTENLQRNAKHYSMLGSLGPSAVVWNAERLGVGIHFNTAVWWQDHSHHSSQLLPVQACLLVMDSKAKYLFPECRARPLLLPCSACLQMIKYGVIGTQMLYDDLQYWDTLYIAGRMQKPVMMLKDYAAFPLARKTNLDAAMTMALLLLPEQFTLQDLYAKICGVSYIGDVRMGFAEDSRKVERIAAGSAAGLAQMYNKRFKGPIAERAKLLQKPDSSLVQDSSMDTRVELMASLPYGMLKRLAAATQPFSFSEIAESAEVAHRIAHSTANTGTYQDLLRAAVASIVRPSSRRQAWSGLFMAGGARSISYVWQKVLKANRSGL